MIQRLIRRLGSSVGAIIDPRDMIVVFVEELLFETHADVRVDKGLAGFTSFCGFGGGGGVRTDQQLTLSSQLFGPNGDLNTHT